MVGERGSAPKGGWALCDVVQSSVKILLLECPSVQWQPDGSTIHAEKWFLGARILGSLTIIIIIIIHYIIDTTISTITITITITITSIIVILIVFARFLISLRWRRPRDGQPVLIWPSDKMGTNGDGLMYIVVWFTSSFWGEQ